MSETPLPIPPRPGVVETVQNSKFLRVLLLGFLSLLLLIPIASIRELIREREQTRDQAKAEIARQWGGAQQLAGPFLVLPYRTVREVLKDGKTVLEEGTAYGVLLPEELGIDAEQRSEFRQRGIFTIPVYSSSAQLRGRFARPSLAAIGVPDQAILWDQAELVLMLSDLRALRSGLRLQAGGQSLSFQPGGGQLMIGLPVEGKAEGESESERGGIVHAPWPLAGEATDQDFALSLSFNGSEQLQFVPLGRLTKVGLQGDWPSPSFNGAWLPLTRSVGSAAAPGFKADWEISDLSRSFGQVWRGDEIPYRALAASAFGLRLYPAVDEYVMAHRAVKYAQLFIVLTFALWWLFEIVGGVRLHPLQYLLVGAGLCAFYLLQLALAEHFGFRLSYALAAAAVTVQITLYSWSALHSLFRASGIGLAMAGLYSYLFAVLREENYALLTGAVGLFLMLSLIMWITRRIDWGGEARTAS
ncbi:MAG: cell envelope integrity protein CreD [Stagnimonas sp.]|nr:cell envelope integrity protein CreD [Stagnimonas sp.]